ncbi:MAG: serine hydrolase [Formosimonas sp.]
MKSTLKLSLLSLAAMLFALPAQAKTPVKPVPKTTAKVAKAAPVVKKEVAPRVVKAKPVYKVTQTSYGRQYGLDQAFDPLELRASVALVVDQNSWTTQYEKNSRQTLPIASITKLMTAMVTLDAGLDMNEPITISEEEAAHYRSSRLAVGTTLPRRDVMLLALMSSENRAAYALGRTYPGGMGAFIQAMNAKAAMLGMSNAQFVDPSGLSPSNQASAMDLAKMVNAASQYRTIRQLSTTELATVYTPYGKELVYHNSNRLISRNMGWNIGMQKTGTLSAAGKCVVIQAVINGSPKIIVLLDSRSSDSRVADAVRIKSWLESGGAGTISRSQNRLIQAG